MKYISILLLTSIFLVGCKSSGNLNQTTATMVPIETSLDLTMVNNDRVPVTINPGKFTQETVIYRLPKVVQGTYAVSDFGSFVEEFKAFDYQGNELTVTSLDTNSWSIANAVSLDKITYYVNDTFDIENEQQVPFSPSGTNISDKNYVLNLHGFIGYFDSLKNNQYKLDVTSFKDVVRTSALQNVGTKTSEDGSKVTVSYFAPRYFEITDNPMMYGDLDVEEFNVGNIKIVLSVYSPNKVHSASQIKETMFKMMQGQKAYLGDVDSTPRYDIYLYLAGEGAEEPTGFGALEHHTSTVVVLPEMMQADQLASSMTDVVSHEFFHIVTPLSVHSEDVHYFDYNAPTFSKHLWMYEGVTEYFATLFQVDQDLVTEEEFYGTIVEKIQTASGLDDSMSFTVMSENILEDPYAKNYYNVYQKGALIGMCVDILMREASNGNRGILSLMKELSSKYGKNKPFEDDKIIDEIVAMTYPSLRTFFDTHVIGTTPIDYSTFFDKVGLELTEGEVKTNYLQTPGGMVVRGDRESQTIVFSDAVLDNSFWREQGAKPNDVITEVDGVVVTLQNANEVFQKVFMWQAGKDIDVKLNRGGEEITIKTKLTPSFATGKKLQAKPNVSSKELALRKAWLKG